MGNFKMTTQTTKAFLNQIIWSDPKQVTTKYGVSNVRTAKNFSSTKNFWDLWKTSKEVFKQNGISVSKFDDEWILNKWEGKKEEVKPVEEKVEEKQEAIINTNVELKYSHLLLPYQINHVKNLISSIKTYNAALDASDTGTGKTYASLAVAKELNLFPIVLTPKSVVSAFTKVMKHFEIEGFVSNYEQYKLGKTPYYKLTEKKEFEWTVPENAIILYDECHRSKSMKTKNADLLVKAKKQNIKILAMSATIASNPLHMYAVGFMLGLFPTTKAFYGWCFRNGVRKGRFGLEFKGGSACLHRIHKEIFPNKGARIKIADLGDAFPETLIIAENYDMSSKNQIQEVYDEMKSELRSLKKKSEDDTENHLTIMLRARQQIELLKVPTIIEMSEDAIEEGNSVAIFVNFNDTVKALADKLKTDCIIWGSNKAGERDANIEKFQNNTSKIIICNIAAGGIGISLHDTIGDCHRMSIISPSWSAEQLKQALGRVHRAGGSKSVQKIVFCAGTIEERICEVVKEKLNNISVLNDGDIASNIFN